VFVADLKGGFSLSQQDPEPSQSLPIAREREKEKL
jgi:hypothetical protein